MKLKKCILQSSNIIILCLLLFQLSCKTKQIVKNENLTSSKNLIESVLLAQPKFETANVSRMTMQVQLNGRSMNVSANCKMITDSVIQVSIMPVFGIELFKIEFSPDSIRIFDKLNRALYATDYLMIESKFKINVGFADIQSIISNQIFVLGNKNTDHKQWKQTITNNKKTLLELQLAGFNQSSTIDEWFRVIETKINSEQNKMNLITQYSNFINFDTVLFPETIYVTASNIKNNFSCKCNISKVVFNSDIEVVPTNTTNYERKDFKQFMTK